MNRRSVLQGLVGLLAARFAPRLKAPALGATIDTYNTILPEGWWVTFAARHLEAGYDLRWKVKPDADEAVLQAGVDVGAWTIVR